MRIFKISERKLIWVSPSNYLGECNNGSEERAGDLRPFLWQISAHFLFFGRQRGSLGKFQGEG